MSIPSPDVFEKLASFYLGRHYDLATDPDERNNLASEKPDRVKRLGEVLGRWYGDGFPHRPQAPTDLKPQEQQMLRELGYLDDES